MTHVAAPGYYVGDLSKEGSLASWVDRVIFGPHIWKQGIVYDPEGLLSTMGALATTLFGILTGNLIRAKDKTPIEKVALMFVAGIGCMIVGWCWNPWFPINKSLWTSSYVFFTGGLALQFLALCYWLIDIKGYKWWTKPFRDLWRERDCAVCRHRSDGAVVGNDQRLYGKVRNVHPGDET